MSGMIVAPEIRDLNVLSQELVAWIAPRMPQARDLQAVNLAYPFGAGMSHETILFDLHWTENGRPMERGLVVRIKPTWHTVYPDDLFEQQYQLMHLMHERRIVPVAQTLWFEHDPALLGAPFFVMQQIYGRVAVSMPSYADSGWVVEATPEQRHQMGCNGVRQLAAIQRLPLSAASFLEGPEGAKSGLEQEWDKYRRFAAWVSQDRRWLPLERATEHLERTWPKHQPAGLVWGDARIGNMMFDENCEVVAVTDWEQPSLGGALHDLAWWLEMAALREWNPDGRPTLPGFLTRAEVISLWQAETGIAVDDLQWYIDFTRFKVACLGIRTASLRGWPTPKEDDMMRRLNLPAAQ